MLPYEKLKALASYLGVSEKKIRRDEALGRTVIRGRRGCIFVDNGHWIAAVDGMSRTKFAWVKKHLSFMKLLAYQETNDVLSDAKAVLAAEFRLDRMPIGEEAEVVRKIVGIAKKRVHSEEHRQALRKRLSKIRSARQGTKMEGTAEAT